MYRQWRPHFFHAINEDKSDVLTLIYLESALVSRNVQGYACEGLRAPAGRAAQLEVLRDERRYVQLAAHGLETFHHVRGSVKGS